MANKWDDVDRIVRGGTKQESKADAEATAVLVPELALPTSLSSEIAGPVMPETGNLLDRYKAQQINRKVARAHWEKYYDAQLEVLTHQLKEAVRAKSAEMTMRVDAALLRLNSDNLKFMAELGLKNVEQRQTLLVKLQEQTSRQMQDVLERDWPPSLKDQTIEQLLEMSKSFAMKLNRELGERPDRD